MRIQGLAKLGTTLTAADKALDEQQATLCLLAYQRGARPLQEWPLLWLGDACPLSACPRLQHRLCPHDLARSSRDKLAGCHNMWQLSKLSGTLQSFMCCI